MSESSQGHKAPTKGEGTYNPNPIFNAELLKRLKPVGTTLGDDVLIRELKAWKEYGHPQWSSLMFELTREQRGSIITALGYLMNGRDLGITVGDVRKLEIEELATIHVGNPDKPSYLGKTRAGFLKDIVKQEPQATSQ